MWATPLRCPACPQRCRGSNPPAPPTDSHAESSPTSSAPSSQQHSARLSRLAARQSRSNVTASQMPVEGRSKADRGVIPRSQARRSIRPWRLTGSRISGETERRERASSKALPRRSASAGRVFIGFGTGQAQKTPRLVGDVAEIEEAAAFADHVEQIAMFAGGGVGLMCS